uniref:Carboxypeptidase regulatory-like domain-containing protein n=1 Tax=Strongyloides venezuelensis TaxID=75913 RepID=A0A0K0FUK8_STRVS
MIFIFIFSNVNAYLQGIKVEGRILCQNVPISDLEISLKDQEFFFDDTLQKGKTDKDGYFILSGKDYEFTKITPYIQLTWTCPKYYIKSHHDTLKFYVLENATIYYHEYLRYYYNFGDIDLYNVVNDLYQLPEKYV